MNSSTTEQRVKRGQSQALGDTGDGVTGVSEEEQGISNRPGDQAAEDAAADPDAISTDQDIDELGDDEELEAADETDEDEDEDVDEDDDVIDPEAEPGKPI
jgi:hypothetical protein